LTDYFILDETDKGGRNEYGQREIELARGWGWRGVGSQVEEGLVTAMLAFLHKVLFVEKVLEGELLHMEVTEQQIGESTDLRMLTQGRLHTKFTATHKVKHLSIEYLFKV